MHMSKKPPKSTKKLKPTNFPEAELVIAPRLNSGLATADQEKATKAASALPALGNALAGPAAEFWRNLTQNAPSKPSEVEVSLGLSFEGGTKWAIVATVEATIEVTLKWAAK
jgi:hypothetical protein